MKRRAFLGSLAQLRALVTQGLDALEIEEHQLRRLLSLGSPPTLLFRYSFAKKDLSLVISVFDIDKQAVLEGQAQGELLLVEEGHELGSLFQDRQPELS